MSAAASDVQSANSSHAGAGSETAHAPGPPADGVGVRQISDLSELLKLIRTCAAEFSKLAPPYPLPWEKETNSLPPCEPPEASDISDASVPPKVFEPAEKVEPVAGFDPVPVVSGAFEPVNATSGPDSVEATLARRDAGVMATFEPGADMPVLDAFRDFLEKERRRSERRVLLLSRVFAGVLVVLVGVGGLAGTALYRHMSRQIDKVETAAREEAKRASSAAETRVTEALSHIDQLSETVRQHAFDGNLATTVIASVESNMLASSHLFQKQAETITGDMDRLREENNRLREQFFAISRAVEMMHQRISGGAGNASASGRTSDSGSATAVSVQSRSAAQPLDTRRTESIGVIVIAPDGAAVPWRLMAPE